MVVHALLFLVATATMAEHRKSASDQSTSAPRILKLGGDPSPGLLVNLSTGARPFDPPDPSRPTLVFIHGLNLAPRTIRFTMADEFASAVRRRGGHSQNILAWNWNAATFVSVNRRANDANAMSQGVRLAAALQGSRIDSSQIHMIGQSAGGIVAASAARHLKEATGRQLAQLTLLDPEASDHDWIFGRLSAVDTVARIENYWVPGPWAIGREIRLEGVRNFEVSPRSRLGSFVTPLSSGHLHVVRWYILGVENPQAQNGFNTSVFALP